MNNSLLRLLCCPICKGKLKAKKKLECQVCKETYPIIDEIPYLLPPSMQEDAEKIRQIYEQPLVAKKYGKTEAFTGSVHYHKKLRHIAIRLASRLAKKKALLLEVGCGNGLILSAIARKRPDLKLIGLDFSLAMLKEARSRLGKKAFFVAGSVDALPIQNRAVDGTICVDTLKNIPKEEQMFIALRELLRITKRDGFFIIECIIKTFFDTIIKWVYKMLQHLLLKKKVEKTPLAGISAKKISLKKIITLFRENGISWKIYKVNPLLNWRLFFGIWRKE